jgi:excisionase family DNA binding protein
MDFQLRARQGRKTAMKNKTPAPDLSDGKLFTIAQVCEILKCRPSKVYNLKYSGRLVFVKLGRRTLVPEQSLRDLINSLERSP